MTPAQVHNTIGMIVDTYGALLKKQAEEIAALKEQNQTLMMSIKIEKAKLHEYQVATACKEVPSPSRGDSEVTWAEAEELSKAHAATYVGYEESRKNA